MLAESLRWDISTCLAYRVQCFTMPPHIFFPYSNCLLTHKTQLFSIILYERHASSYFLLNTMFTSQRNFLFLPVLIVKDCYGNRDVMLVKPHPEAD